MDQKMFFFKKLVKMNRSKNTKETHVGMLVLIIAAIPNPDPREPSPDLSEAQQEGTSKEDRDPNTNQSGIKDDRTHDREEAQAEQKEKYDEEKPDLSGDINV